MGKAEEIRIVWEQQPEVFPAFLEENPDIFLKTDIRQKTENEALVSEFSGRLKKKFCKKPKNEEDKKQWEQDLELEFLSFLEKEKILSLSEQIAPELLTAWKRETKRFMEKVQSFDETLNQEQLWQALRNYFIYAMMVEMQGEEPNAKNPILAYSLLYPYTDNYIDDKRVSGQEKERYNRMIASKLREEAVAPEHPLEKKTCHLLNMILKEYLFAASDWLDEEEQFYLKFGFLLQLVDDLQDISEDRENGSHTLMTQAEEQQRLEQCVNRQLWFSWNAIREFHPKNPTIKDFVLKNCVGITILAAAMNQKFFSMSYIKALEPYLPFSLEFLKKSEKLRRTV